MNLPVCVLITSMWFSTLCCTSQKNAQNQTTPQQLLQSIQHDLCDRKYYQDILPNNFSYLTQLLEYGVTTKQPREYAHSVLGLFSKLLKGSEYVNSYIFVTLLEKFPTLLSPYFTQYKLESAGTSMLTNDLDMLERLEKAVTAIVYSKFTKDFSTCKNNPELFLDDLAHKIIAVTSQEISTEQLRHSVIRFLEVGLSKLIWNPHDTVKTWESIKSISQQLITLMERNIIDDIADIDELSWTLVHRYRFFLELHNTVMPISFYVKAKEDIVAHKLALLEIPEQEPFLTKKSDCLLQTVLTQEAKRHALEYPST